MTTLTAETENIDPIATEQDNTTTDLETLMNENEQDNEIDSDEDKTEESNIEAHPLTGAALLKRVAQCYEESLNEKETAINCGYFSIDDAGVKRAKTTLFLKNLVAVKGFDFSRNANKSKRRGRKAVQEITVHRNQQVVISRAYTEQLGWEPGDLLTVKLGKKGLRLLKKDYGDQKSSVSVDDDPETDNSTLALLDSESDDYLNGHKVENQSETEDQYDDDDDDDDEDED